MSSGRKARVFWPARAPWTNDTVWLTTGRRALLFYLRGQLAHGRHEFRLAHLAEVSGIDRSNVQRALDQFAWLGLIGRRSTRGRNGRTMVWNIGRRRAWAEAQVRALRYRRPVTSAKNVATSTPFGGYLSRERWRAAVGAGEDRAVRRLTPPRTLYGRCAAGHRARLTRWTFRRWPGANQTIVRAFEGVWRGQCRRCGEHVRLADRIEVPATRRRWAQVGELIEEMEVGRGT